MFIALREIRRAPGRFALLGGAVGLLILLLLFFQTVAGTLVGSLTGGLSNQSAEVLVYSDRARANPLASVLAPPTLDAVSGVDGVEAAGPVGYSVFPARIGDQEIDLAVWATETGGPGVPTTVTEGRSVEADGEAVVASSAFDDPVEVGDELSVAEGALTVEVVGLADDAAFNVLPTAYLTFADYERLLSTRIGGGPVPLSAVAVTPAGDADEVAEAITSTVDGVEALPRAAAVDALPGVSTISRSFNILYALLYVVVAIVTGVFFLILTVQKRDSLVLLRAVGARPGDLVRPVLAQIVAVVGIGVVVGTAVAAALLAASRETFGAALEASTAVTSAAAVLALGLLAGTAAVRRVQRIEPIEVVRTGGLE